MNCKNYMWLKFVKGLSFKEKCKFSSVKISILLYKKAVQYRTALVYMIYYRYCLFYLKYGSAVAKTFKAEFPMVFSHS